MISINMVTKKRLHNESNNALLKLPTEIFYDIMDMLFIRDLQNLSWTCRLLYHITRKYHFGVISPIWESEEISHIDIPVTYYRHGVWLNDIFYLPIFHIENPFCWLIDLTIKPIKWFQKPLIIEPGSELYYEPTRYYAAAAIKNSIYIFGGENINKGITTNIFYELNVSTFTLRVINENNVTPSPRMMHTLDVIDNHRLAMFGGLIIDDKNLSYDSKDFAIYDIKTKNWNCYAQESNIPYQRSLPCSHITKGKLYIYGGQKYKFFSNSSEIHDDEDISVFDFYKEKWYKLLNLSSIDGRSSKMLLPPDWILTSSTYQRPVPGKRIFAGMFTMNNRIAIFGGSKKDDWFNEKELNRPWELMYLLSTVNHHWEYVRIKNLPQIEVLTIYWKGWNVHEGLFLIGKDKNEGNLIMGWVKDSKFII
ncbi:hypothetical protein RclHR1_03000001 [Rhizophagus clarus]|nr:hypothetical protein RclHR1_03000001 [Rhizophagus clarus]